MCIALAIFYFSSASQNLDRSYGIGKVDTLPAKLLIDSIGVPKIIQGFCIRKKVRYCFDRRCCADCILPNEWEIIAYLDEKKKKIDRNLVFANKNY